MATRYSGDLVVKIAYHDDDSYRGSVRGPGGIYKFKDLHAPPIGHGSGIAYDSPKAYDKMARAAISFATYDKEGIGYPDYDDRGEAKVSRRRARKRKRHGKRLRRPQLGRRKKNYSSHTRRSR